MAPSQIPLCYSTGKASSHVLVLERLVQPSAQVYCSMDMCNRAPFELQEAMKPQWCQQIQVLNVSLGLCLGLLFSFQTCEYPSEIN